MACNSSASSSSAMVKLCIWAGGWRTELCRSLQWRHEYFDLQSSTLWPYRQFTHNPFSIMNWMRLSLGVSLNWGHLNAKWLSPQIEHFLKVVATRTFGLRVLVVELSILNANSHFQKLSELGEFRNGFPSPEFAPPNVGYFVRRGGEWERKSWLHPMYRCWCHSC